MPIRKSITGVRPVTPILVPAAKGKPVAVPRKTAFVPVPKRPRTIPSEETAIKKAFAAIPIGQVILETTWSRDHTLPFLKKKFTIWGIDLALYPSATRVTKDGKHYQKCFGVLVAQVKRNNRNQPVSLMLRGDHKLWFGELLHWIETKNYP